MLIAILLPYFVVSFLISYFVRMDVSRSEVDAITGKGTPMPLGWRIVFSLAWPVWLPIAAVTMFSAFVRGR